MRSSQFLTGAKGIDWKRRFWKHLHELPHTNENFDYKKLRVWVEVTKFAIQSFFKHSLAALLQMRVLTNLAEQLIWTFIFVNSDKKAQS